MEQLELCVFVPEEIAPVIVAAAQNVFSTMLNLALEPREASQEPAVPSTFDGVVALVGIAGPWTGTGRISCSSHFACKVAGALLMSPLDAVNEDVLDAFAEVANMIVGNVKTSLEERLGPLALSTPTVIFGRNYKTRSAGVLQWTVVPFHCEGETMEVRFCLLPATQHQGMVRPEQLHL